MAKKPEILARRTVAKTRMFEVEQTDLRFANGVETTYERIRGASRGAVLVVPMPDPESVWLIREYAGGTERYELGFPKGRIDGEEAPLEAANRELMEEIGQGARKLEELAQLSLAPGFIGALTHIILARELYPQTLPGDEPEPIEIVPWRLNELDALLEHEEFSEARGHAALFLTLRYLERGVG